MMAKFLGNKQRQGGEMTVYTGKEFLGEYTDIGFQLKEADYLVGLNRGPIELWFKDRVIAYFDRTRLTMGTARATCERYLAELNNVFMEKTLQDDNHKEAVSPFDS